LAGQNVFDVDSQRPENSFAFVDGVRENRQFHKIEAHPLPLRSHAGEYEPYRPFFQTDILETSRVTLARSAGKLLKIKCNTKTYPNVIDSRIVRVGENGKTSVEMRVDVLGEHSICQSDKFRVVSVTFDLMFSTNKNGFKFKQITHTHVYFVYLFYSLSGIFFVPA